MLQNIADCGPVAMRLTSAGKPAIKAVALANQLRHHRFGGARLLPQRRDHPPFFGGSPPCVAPLVKQCRTPLANRFGALEQKASVIVEIAVEPPHGAVGD